MPNSPKPVTIKRLGVLDFLLMLVVLSGSVAFFYFFPRIQASKAVFYLDNKLIAEYEFSDPPVVKKIKGVHGELIIQIDGAGVSMLKSSCPKKICVKQGRIKNQSQTIVCVPNHFMIALSGRQKDTIDGVAR